MDSAWERLTRMLPPPVEGEVAPVPWHLSRAEVGLDFPADYRRFVDRYGAGDVISLDWVYTPYPDEAYEPEAPIDRENFSIYSPSVDEKTWLRGRGFPGFVDYTAEQIRDGFVFDGADESYWGGTMYPIHPDPGGLLAWGESSMDGDVLYWLTEDPDPDRWPVVMWARGPATTYRFEGGMVEFLAAVLAGEHPDITWLAWPRLAWKLRSDWLRARP